MPGLRIGIDVGGTFTHGVVLRPPGEVVATAVTPTTHTDPRGVAAGVAEVLRLLLAEMERLGLARGDIELVAHSSTQATNALLEGDVSPVHRVIITPQSEQLLALMSLKDDALDIGNGHTIEQSTEFVPVADAHDSPAFASSASFHPPAEHEHGAADRHRPVALIQTLADKGLLLEQGMAAQYTAAGRPAVCASDITQILGLQARARTAVVNAAMLPNMLSTADFTERAVNELLPGVPIQVVRGDGGAMSLAELRRQPVHSLLSGPAAGASAALHLSREANAVFIEVGGTSTDITLIQDGKVRHRYATVGGQRLLVPALDLRTVAVGGGSMLRADTALFGPRSAHIAGLPYLFQALQTGLTVAGAERWVDPHSGTPYVVAKMDDGSLAALTMTDTRLAGLEPNAELFGSPLSGEMAENLRRGMQVLGAQLRFGLPAKRRAPLLIAATHAGKDPAHLLNEFHRPPWSMDEERVDAARVVYAFESTCNLVVAAIDELTRTHRLVINDTPLLAGGGGAKVIHVAIAAERFAATSRVLQQSAVISAIGAALAVTCVSLSKSVGAPTARDIALLTQEVEARLAAQGAERVSTDYEFDPQRQILTVTGRGSRPYEQEARPRSDEELAALASKRCSGKPRLAWHSPSEQLWALEAEKNLSKKSTDWFVGFVTRSNSAVQSLSLDRCGRTLWQGRMKRWFPFEAGQRDAVLADVIARCTQYTDGGPALPGLALLCDGRFIPLDLGNQELITEVLRWEKLSDEAPGCFIVRG